MRVLKTSVATLFGLFLSPAAQADQGLVVHSATCAGQLSAQLEHRWLMGDPGADRTEAARDAMLALLGAVADVAEPAVMARRIEAKQAHAALLQRAAFGRDRADAERAEKLATRAVAACAQIVAGYLGPDEAAQRPSADPGTREPAQTNAALLEQ